jgi:hypothetical protein
MRLALAAALSLVLAAPAYAEAPVPPKPAVTHYRTLEKMLRKFSRQAGTPAPGGKIFASR